ncbi:MAG: valine--tRNA ligase, partial [Anaerolineales bacterium]
CTHCGSEDIRQDEDVLDTWFSSGLWPFSTLGWPDEISPDMERFFPNDMRETGYDILFFWVARETMLSLALLGKAPYAKVYLHGLIRNEEGKKISKSMEDAWKYDPLYIIDEYGTDALRYTLTTSSSPGNDMNLDSRRLEGARNFANKMWQSARFILMNIGDEPVEPLSAIPGDALVMEDRWILSRLYTLTGEVTTLMDQYLYGEAGRRIRDFLWDEFCDWYIEATKVRLYAEGEDKAVPITVLLTVLEQALRLLHPFMPFVSEAIWQALPASGRQGEALMMARWPEEDPAYLDAGAEAQMAAVIDLVRGIRNVRAEYHVEPARRISMAMAAHDLTGVFQERQDVLIALARLDADHLIIAEGIEPIAQSATVMVGDLIAYLPLAGLVDLDEERERLRKVLEGLTGRIEGSEKRLNGPFAERAPQEIVQKERDNLEAMKLEADQVQEQLGRLR